MNILLVTDWKKDINQFFKQAYFTQGCRIANWKVHRAMTSSFLPPYAGDLRLGYVTIALYYAPPPFLTGSQYFCPFEEVEDQLPELAINAVYDHFGKPGSVSMMIEMTDSEVLFDDIADFWNGLVSFFLILR